jgi:hypothetical protein
MERFHRVVIRQRFVRKREGAGGPQGASGSRLDNPHASWPACLRRSALSHDDARVTERGPPAGGRSGDGTSVRLEPCAPCGSSASRLRPAKLRDRGLDTEERVSLGVPGGLSMEVAELRSPRAEHASPPGAGGRRRPRRAAG